MWQRELDKRRQKERTHIGGSSLVGESVRQAMGKGAQSYCPRSEQINIYNDSSDIYE